MDKENPAFTGFFDAGRKRIDLVIVMNDGGGTEEIEEVRINFLMNALKFGFEIELEQGKLPEHKNLIFIKIHAPDDIIEEFGLYFNERIFFKDAHMDFINPLYNIFGMNNERDVLKLLIDQYPGSGNYSTLERSMIVYKIFLQLKFGQYENYFGINKLIKNNIILDAFALHDGPYFIESKQETTKYVNSRQALFYNWVGMINIWKLQPIHLIKEYLGVRVAFYFGFYDYFNLMLVIISLLGAWTAITNYYEIPVYNDITNVACELEGASKTIHEPVMICSECRNFTICPILHYKRYCKELKFIARIDNSRMFFYAFFVCLWGILFGILWKRKEKYLSWIWEVNEKYITSVIRSDYESNTKENQSKLSNQAFGYQSNFPSILRIVIYCLTAAIFVGLVYGLIVFSVYMCYFKHWFRHRVNDTIYDWKRNEHLYIGMSALMYSIIAYVVKIVATVLSHIFTGFEGHKTYRSYDRSIAVKLYGFCFVCIFTLPMCYIFVGEVFFTNIGDVRNYHPMGGFAVLNNGAGTSLDDICITLVILVIVDQIIFKIPTLFYNKTTDYTQISVFDTDIPCWEREYKLPILTEVFIHNNYNAIAIQFTLGILFSCVFPLTPLLILLTNILDIRCKAKKVLLEHRRPLLLNVSGPGIWHKLIHITAHVAPLLNLALITYQSRLFRYNFSSKYIHFFSKTEWRSGKFALELFSKTKEYAKQYMDARDRHLKLYNWYPDFCTTFDYWMSSSADNIYVPPYSWWHVRLYEVQFAYMCWGLLFITSLLMHFLLFFVSDDIQATIEKEKIIKQKFYIRKGFAP